ncbi:hypothetical protein WJU16_02725 [Chitinophaga pollutisoli]|uniref:Uncharacterized protein n=1 Tax=Chitinophaga pollutisoli TaxID=3133966 RepID=A0ABZ2YQ91_9BACT
MEKIAINGIEYYADIDGMLFQNCVNPSDIIRVDVLLDKSSHYEMLYIENGISTAVKVPQFVQADPEGMRSKYGLAQNDPLPSCDADFRCRQDLLENRLNNHMRTILQIDKWKYKADGFSGTIRPCFTTGQHPAFLINDFETTDTGFRIYIDQSNGFIIPRKSIGEKGNFIYADLPDLYVLDPIGTCQNSGEDHSFFTQRFPVREQITITKTGSFKFVAMPKKLRTRHQIPITARRRGIK